MCFKISELDDSINLTLGGEDGKIAAISKLLVFPSMDLDQSPTSPRFPVSIISQAVLLYHHNSYRDIQEQLALHVSLSSF